MMKKNVFLTLILSIQIVTITVGQDSPEKAKIETQVESLRKAMVDPDRTILDKLVSPRLSYGHSSGKVDTKESFINGLVSGESDFIDINLSDQTVEVIDDVALVRHKLSGHTQDKGKDPSTVNIGVLLVWHKSKNEWKLVGRQAFKL